MDRVLPEPPLPHLPPAPPRPQSECDSEVIALLLARGRGTITRRAVWAADQVAGDLALLGVWRRPDRLLVVRRGKPLHVGQGADGYYFASLPDELPGRVRPISDPSARVLVCTADELQLEQSPLAVAGGGRNVAFWAATSRVPPTAVG
ncbi:MAG: hypothetical protein IPM18_05460 [Phycisphaerales bacterium]|nr:hypothetical protein [Phycisphaerales bacterium]